MTVSCHNDSGVICACIGRMIVNNNELENWRIANKAYLCTGRPAKVSFLRQDGLCNGKPNAYTNLWFIKKIAKKNYLKQAKTI